MTHQATRASRTNGHFKLLSLAVALMALGATPGVDGARILRADADPIYSVWDPSDICGQPVRQSTGDQLALTCAGCLERPGCAIESTTGKCVSVARINTTVDVEYLIAGQTHYCDDIDNANSLCGADNTTSVPVCRGAKGCVSVHQCEIAAAIAAPLSSSQSSFRVYYVLIGGALLATALLMMRLYKSLSSDVMSAFDRRMHARRTHTAKPLTMKLDGWRGFIAKEREEQSENIEIKLCPTRASEDAGAAATDAPIMNDYQAQRNHRAASTEEGDDESKDRDVEYVAVTTPRNGGGDAAGEHSRRL